MISEAFSLLVVPVVCPTTELLALSPPCHRDLPSWQQRQLISKPIRCSFPPPPLAHHCLDCTPGIRIDTTLHQLSPSPCSTTTTTYRHELFAIFRSVSSRRQETAPTVVPRP
ncbi:hypothetical protein F5X68DRAFT_64787 [Plectosphaerella plurivora]|uniref:Uncharacterized protein n=1 Tax=Plectosphaerella plurivora TaxID=936078 RepID=A0A9P8VFZ2_9PEZI|nr:hypothetical protein F5X68DRAFT_64787 [Plectosphaerella plurivora]